MTVRIFAIAMVAVLAGGCARDSGASFGGPSYLGAGSLQMVGAAQAADRDDIAEAPRKTMAGKVLSAMALERVTGRKPDPSRLNDLD